MINCAKHPEREAAGMCVSCGKPFCEECLSEIEGKNYCKSCLAEMVESHRQKNIPAARISTKKKSAAILLWLFLGGLGAHRFYIGRCWSGLAMLLLWAFNTITVYSASSAILGGWDVSSYLNFLADFPLAWGALLIHGIWCFVDIVLILSNLLTDSKNHCLM